MHAFINHADIICNTVVVAKLSIVLFCFPYHIADRRDASGSLLSSETYVYDISAHAATPPVIPIITTSIDSLNVTAEIGEFKNDVGLFLIGQQPPYVLQAMTLGQKYHFLKYHFVPSIDHTFPEEYMGGCE